MKNNEDTFLAKWLSGDLTEDQQKKFEQGKDFQLFQKIAEASNRLKVPDFNKEEAFDKLKAARIKQKKIRKISWSLSMVASIALFLCSTFLLIFQESTQSGYGQQTTVLLPDGSKVILNAQAKLTYYKWNWSSKRKVNLKGEAYFQVQKNEIPFLVKSELGTVEVLGTQFNVRDKDDFYEVNCYTGKVKVSSKYAQKILTKEMGFRQENKTHNTFQVENKNPTWINGETTVKDVSLQQVLLLLKEQYHLTFVSGNIDLTQRFSGTFTNKDVHLALQTVFSALEIKYQMKDQTVTLSK